MKQKTFKRSLFSIPPSIWAIGIVTLFMNISTLIVFSLSPLYLTAVLGVSTFGVGILEGVVETISWLTRIFSGSISDLLHRRKPLLVIAYGLTALSRPLFALAPNVVWVFFSRSLDRIGNGLQATPREALVGDLAPSHLKGSSYGLRQTLGVLGSMIGALLTAWWIRKQGNDFKTIFWMASIFPLLGVLVLIFFVKESPLAASYKRRYKFSTYLKHVQHLSLNYWKVVAIGSLFMFSNYSGAFLILQAKSKMNSDLIAPLLMIFQNLAAALTAYPVGYLSDKMDRRNLLALGFFVTVLSNTCFAYASGMAFILLGATLWGVQLGITQSLLLAQVAETSQEDVRGTAFGIYYASIGLILLASNAVIGWIFDQGYSTLAFHVSSLAAGLALIALFFFKVRSTVA